MSSAAESPCKHLLNETNAELHYEDIPIPNLQVSHPGNLMRLCESLINSSTKHLETKINIYLQKETKSETVFLINVLKVSDEAVIQAVSNEIIEPCVRTNLNEDAINSLIELKPEELRCATELDEKIVTLIRETVQQDVSEVLVVPVLKIKNCHTDTETQRCCTSILPVFLVCMVKPRKEETLIPHLVHETFRFCLSLLLNTRECEEERRLKQQCQSLLLVARKLFSHLGDLSDLLKEIMSEARRLTNAERCSLFLLDPDHMHLVAKVFDGVSPSENHTEVRIAKDQGIAGHVAATGEMLNIKDAYKHPLFYKGMDEATGFKTRNILCFAIRDEDSIVGVAQLCNKIDGCFDYFDEQVANAFSIYCGISIMHSLVYKKIQDAQARSKLSNELMMYHMQVSDKDVGNVLLCPNPHSHADFHKFSFIPRKVLAKETPCYVLKMFTDLNFIETFRIRKETLTRFILYVRKMYRDVPYHNWLHAFSVAHFAYCCIKNFHLLERGYLSDLEALALLVSCLCHDIDHRGTTNSFQQQSNSVLASLYSSEGSVMERHHLSQTLCTLNTEGCNFLESLNRQDYISCLDLIKDMILATDLATHYKLHAKQLIMATEGYCREKPEHRYYLSSLLMTCADLSDQTKDWTEAKRVAQMIYAEFFTQGDMEKKMGKKPANMMDREKASIPDHQLEFLKECCLCIYKLLATMFPEAEILVASIQRNIVCWEQSKRVFDRLCTLGKTSYEVLAGDELDNEVKPANLGKFN